MTSAERFDAWWRLPDSERGILYKIIAHDAWKEQQKEIDRLEAALAEARLRAEMFEIACTKALNERDEANRKLAGAEKDKKQLSLHLGNLRDAKKVQYEEMLCRVATARAEGVEEVAKMVELANRPIYDIELLIDKIRAMKEAK